MNSSIKMVKGLYVIHFLQLLTEAQDKGDIDNGYNMAIKNAKAFGGRKFHNKAFGGGVAFDYQADAENALEWVEKMNKEVWVYVITHKTGTVEWHGHMTAGQAKELEGDGKCVCSYQNEASYNEMKAGHEKYLSEQNPS